MLDCSNLSGVARYAHQRKVLLAVAAQRVTDRDPDSAADTAALLRTAERLLPRPVRPTVILDDDDFDDYSNVDEDGYDLTPGRSPQYVGLP